MLGIKLAPELLRRMNEHTSLVSMSRSLCLLFFYLECSSSRPPLGCPLSSSRFQFKPLPQSSLFLPVFRTPSPPMTLTQRWANLLCTLSDSNYLQLCNPCCLSTHGCCGHVEAAVDNSYVNVHGSVPIMLYLWMPKLEFCMIFMIFIHFYMK